MRARILVSRLVPVIKPVVSNLPLVDWWFARPNIFIPLYFNIDCTNRNITLNITECTIPANRLTLSTYVFSTRYLDIL